MDNRNFEEGAESRTRAVRHPHVQGMWCYRLADEACGRLSVGSLDFAEAGAPVCAIADVVDVKPADVLAFLQDEGFVTPDAGVAARGVPAAIEHFGGNCLPGGSEGLQLVDDADGLAVLQSHLASGLPAVVFLGELGARGAVVAVAGFDEAREEALLFDPRGAELDGWYPWGWVERRATAFVLASVPEQDHYAPRYIFKQIYGVDIAGHEQRWPDIDLDVLREINPDCIGWVHLGGTPLSYPIVKDHLDRTYYQNYNFSGEQSIHGAVSLAFDNGGSFDGLNLVFSAHRMKDYSMFKMLTFYDRPEFAAENPCIDLLLGNGLYQARVFSAYHFPKGHDDSSRVLFSDRADFDRWLQQRIELSMHPIPVPEHLGKIVTFRTCYGMDNDKMFVVHASLEKAPTQV